MSEAPAISIVIAAYNSGRLLPATLQSIHEQTWRDWECVIVDDGSSDGTLELAREWAARDGRFRVISQKNSGTSAARNRGYAETNPGSRYITFMDHDDLWVPGALETLLKAAEAAPNMAGAHGLADFIDENGRPLEPGEFAQRGRKRIGLGEDGKLREWDLPEPTSFRTLLYNNTVFPPSVVLTRRALYDKVGSFDPAMGLVEDWDMLVRLSRHGDFAFVNEIVVLYRRHGGSLSLKSHETNMRKVRQLQNKTFRSRENTPEQRDIARKVWREIQKECMRGKLEAARRHAASGHLGRAGVTMARIYVEIHRFLRGYPTVRGL